ncbi:histidine triad nucleotide-binding protein [soil metagenome]
MADQCLFCKIVSGVIPVEFVAQNEYAVAFRDIEPKAPVHLLIVPRTHIAGFHEIGTLSGDELGGMLTLINEVAKAQGLGDSGYRVITNIGSDAGQTVFHLHWHVLGGERLGGFA